MSQEQTDGQTDSNDEPMAQPFRMESGPDRDEMASGMLPDEDDWVAKSVLDIDDPHAISVLAQFNQLFPEVGDDLQLALNQFMIEFLKGRTAIGGRGREDYVDIVKSMYGGGLDDEAKQYGAMLRGLGVDEED